MSHGIFIWILVLSLIGVSEGSAYPGQSWDELVTRLRSVDSVSGRAAGFCAVPGDFFKLSNAMIRVGREEDFRTWLSDEQAIVRCKGLLALAQVNGKMAACTCRHPLALSALLWRRNLSIAHDDPGIRRAVADSLVEISRNFKDDSQPWSTYADSAHALTIPMQAERQIEFPWTRILTDAACAEIERNIVESNSKLQSPSSEEGPTGPANAAGGGHAK